jgi:hypothetical protein
LYRYRQFMSSKTEFDVYSRAGDRALRLATSKGAGLPAHVKSKEWLLMPKGKSLVHSDAGRDIAIQGFCLYRIVDGDRHQKG